MLGNYGIFLTGCAYYEQTEQPTTNETQTPKVNDTSNNVENSIPSSNIYRTNITIPELDIANLEITVPEDFDWAKNI